MAGAVDKVTRNVLWAGRLDATLSLRKELSGLTGYDFSSVDSAGGAFAEIARTEYPLIVVDSSIENVAGNFLEPHPAVNQDPRKKGQPYSSALSLVNYINDPNGPNSNTSVLVVGRKDGEISGAFSLLQATYVNIQDPKAVDTLTELIKDEYFIDE